MSRAVEDTKFELENAWLEINKLDYRLANVIIILFVIYSISYSDSFNTNGFLDTSRTKVED